MLERLQFLERIRKHDARVIGNTKDARAEVLGQTQKLQQLIVRYRNITAELVRARDEAAAVQGALLARQAEQLQQRAHTAARLDAVKGQIAGLKRQIARIATRQVAATPGPHSVDLPIDPGGVAQAPPGAPQAVKQVIAAGNAIAGLPYLYGGGHGSFHANAHDFSGSGRSAPARGGVWRPPLAPP